MVECLKYFEPMMRFDNGKARQHYSRYSHIVMSLCCAVVFGPRIGKAFDCCPPPVDPASARFPQNAQVTVYLNPTGLTNTEVDAITIGLEDWSDENNTPAGVQRVG